MKKVWKRAWKKAWKKGEERLNQLIKRLLADSREEEISKVVGIGSIASGYITIFNYKLIHRQEAKRMENVRFVFIGVL